MRVNGFAGLIRSLCGDGDFIARAGSFPCPFIEKKAILCVGMKYTGTVKGGVVVLEAGVKLEDGTVVRVEPVQTSERSTIGQRLKRFAGTARGLPPDMAENHDHYLHGRPKK
jgi:hypothetical protein